MGNDRYRLCMSRCFSHRYGAAKGKKHMTIVLWIVQALLALAFLLTGFLKAFTLLEGLKQYMAWVGDVPARLVRFIGTVEMLVALVLLLPKLTKIYPQLTIVPAIALAFV